MNPSSTPNFSTLWQRAGVTLKKKGSSKIKTAVFILCVSVLLPSPALAAVSVSPSRYTAPAHVTVTGGDGGNRFDVFADNAWVCQTSAIDSIQDLNSTCTVSGSFNSMSSTAGTYHVVLQTVTDCNTAPPMDFATCSGSNPGIPGDNQADFTIIGSSSTGATCSDPTDCIGKALTILWTVTVIVLLVGGFLIAWLLKV